jgi:hypothetical protein
VAGLAQVDGHGSVWTNTAGLSVSGSLSITAGGSVTATSVSLSGYSSPLLMIDVGQGSLLSTTGAFANYGIVRIVAGVAAGSTTCSPISAKSWSGSGKYQAYGGKWNASNHTFTPSSITTGAARTSILLNLASVQRVLIDDNAPGGTGWEVGVSFPAATSTTNIFFGATPISEDLLDELRPKLTTNESILSGWQLSSANLARYYTMYVSLKVGPGYRADEFHVHDFDFGMWLDDVPQDLTYDGTYVSFTAGDICGYAVTVVPEPGTLGLLAAGLLGFLAYARRKRA